MNKLDMWGNLGCYLEDNNVITFQVGTDIGNKFNLSKIVYIMI